MGITVENLNSMKVSSNTMNKYNNKLHLQLQEQFLKNGIISRSQATMLLANMLAMSDRFENIVETWNNKNNPGPKQKSYFKAGNDYGNPSDAEIQSFLISKFPTLFNTTTTALDVAYKYRGRGFIPIIGLSEYLNASIKLQNPNIFHNPDIIDDDSELAIKISIYKWKNFVGKQKFPAFSYGNGGSSNNFSYIVNLLNNDSSNMLEKSFEEFATVLLTYDLYGQNVDMTPPIPGLGAVTGALGL